MQIRILVSQQGSALAKRISHLPLSLILFPLTWAVAALFQSFFDAPLFCFSLKEQRLQCFGHLLLLVLIKFSGKYNVSSHLFFHALNTFLRFLTNMFRNSVGNLGVLKYHTHSILRICVIAFSLDFVYFWL